MQAVGVCAGDCLARGRGARALRVREGPTPEGLGKLRAVAKGVRRIASRKSGHVELFTHSRLMLAEGRNLYVVTQAETVEPFRLLREELIRTTYAYHIVELVEKKAAEIEAAEKLAAETLAAE